MPDAERMMKILRQAAIHNRATRARKGCMIYIPEGDEVLVAGDLHGNLVNFRAILKMADLEHHPRRHLVLQEFVHGARHYPNGGCTSHQLLDLIAAFKCQYPERLHLLPGNHELSEITGRPIAKQGVEQNALFAQGISFAYGSSATAITRGYHDFLVSMPLGVRTTNRVLVTHSIPPVKYLERFDTKIFDAPIVPENQRGKDTSLHHLVWGRDVSEEAANRFALLMDVHLLVTGHIAMPDGFGIPNSRQIIVDCTERPAACVLIPAISPLSHARLAENIRLIV